MEEGKDGEIPTRNQIQSLPYFDSLRPSTVLNMTIARATSLMPLPYEGQQNSKLTLQSYLDDLTQAMEITQSPEISRNFAAGSFPALLTIRASYSDNWRTVPAEMTSWHCVQASLDVLVQRTAVADAAQKIQMRSWYDIILELGTTYFR